MRQLSFIILSSIITSVAAIPSVAIADDKPMDTVFEKLRGRWEIVAGTNQGNEMRPGEVEGTYMIVRNNSITTFDADDLEQYQAVFTVNSDADPIEITMRAVPKNPRLGEQLPSEKSRGQKQPFKAVALGILKFESNNRVQLCYALPGADRPEKFHSPEGSKLLLFTLERRVVKLERSATDSASDK